MASRWEGRIGKLKPWSSKLQSKSTSFIPPRSKEPHPDTCEFIEGRNDIADTNDAIGGTTRQFEPNEEYNFKSAWKRYVKALDIRPSKIKQEERKITYFYYSCKSDSNFWEVTITETVDEFLNLLRFSYVIVCPPDSGFKLTGTIESNATQFLWEQRAGNKTVLFDNNTIKEPTIFIQSTCYTTGCDDGTGLPIILRVSLASDPDIFKDLIIYNTLTSTYFGNSASKGVVSDRACQKVTPIPYISPPEFLQKAYCENVGTTFFVTWNPPSCDSEFVTGYSLVVNTTGSYIEIDSVTVSEEKIFGMELNKHYKIITHFNIYGKIISTPSNILYYVINDIAHLVYGDDSYNGISANRLTNSYSKVDLKVTILEYNDPYQGISANKLTSNYSKVDLKVSVYEYVDNHSGIAASKLTSSYAKVNLGGVVIG